MKKTTLLLLTAALLAGPVMAAGPVSAGQSDKSGTYWWLHPKLGMVKVDKATNAMVTGKRKPAEPAAAAPAMQR